MPRSQGNELSPSREVSGSERTSASVTDESASSPVDVALGSPVSPHQRYSTPPPDEWEDYVDPSDSASVGPPTSSSRSQVEAPPPPQRNSSHPASASVSRRNSSKEARDYSRSNNHRTHRDRPRHRHRYDYVESRHRTASAHSDSMGSHDEYYARGGPGRPHPHPQWAFVPHQPPPQGYASSVASYPYAPPGQQLVHMQQPDPYGMYARQNPLASPPMYPPNPLSPHASISSQGPGYFNPPPQYPMPMMPYQTSSPYYPFPMIPGGVPPAVVAGAAPQGATDEQLAKMHEESFAKLHDLIEKREEERLAREREREAKAAKELAEKQAAAALVDAAKDAAKQATAAAEADAAKKAAEAKEAHDKALAEVKATAEASKEAEKKAKAEAAAAQKAADKEVIKFKDALGRKFSFPFRLCRTWKDMEGLIKQAFKNVEDHEQQILDGQYDLVGPDGEIILPLVWESTVVAGSEITQHLWPLVEEKKDEPAPAPPPAALKKKPKSSRSSRMFAVASAAAPPPPPPAPAPPPAGASPPEGAVALPDRGKKKNPQPLPAMIGWFGGGQIRSRSSKDVKNLDQETVVECSLM